MKTLLRFTPRDKPPRHPVRTTGAPQAADPAAILRRILPQPLDQLGEVLGALHVPRHAGQAALNALIRAGAVQLAHQGTVVHGSVRLASGGRVG